MKPFKVKYIYIYKNTKNTDAVFSNMFFFNKKMINMFCFFLSKRLLLILNDC